MLCSLQAPFSIKEWENSVPAWLIAFAFLVYVGVWTAKQLKGIFGASPDGLTAQQQIEVKRLIDETVWKRDAKGGLHWANNQITRWLWEEEEQKERRKEPRL
jgi:hypothetical protein